METESEERIVNRLHFVSRLCTYVVSAYAGVALLGWFMGIPALTSIRPGFASTSVATAICFALSAFAIHELTDHALGRHSRNWLWLGSVIIVLLVSIYALFGYAAGWAEAGYLFGRALGSLSPATATSFILLTTAVLLTDSGKGRTSAGLSTLGIVIAELDIVGHAYGAEALYRIMPFSTMALPTALAFVVLFAALLLVRPRQGWIQYAVRSDRVGMTFRLLMPTVIVIPFVFGYLTALATEYGLFDPPFAFAILAVATSVVLGGLVCFAAAWLVHADTALRESEIRFRGFLLASPDAMIIVDQTGQILLASHRVETMFGYTSQELAGKSINMLLPEQYRNLHTGHIHEFMKKPESRNIGTGRELKALRKDGSEFPVEINLSPAQTSEGLVVIAAVRNVSVGKAMEKQLRQSQKMEAIGNLTGGMAHDFNNLLGIIIGNLDLLRGVPGASAATDPKIDQLASEALDAALRGADLTKRLLAFARRQSLRPQRINVNELVEGISKLLNRTLGDDIEIKLNLGAEVWPVDADPSQLGASLINICNNARDAMPSGGELIIATSNRNLDEDYAALHLDLAPGNYTLIEVSDTGTGIPPEMLNQIFEPFFTTKEQGKGTGLGLSMVFGFVKQSAGHITVYSEAGHGTTFRLYLPRAATAAAAPETPAVSEHGGHETILAVEDNQGLRRVVVRQLKDLGYRVLEAENGPAALKILQSESVDLLFTDIMMPGGMSGYDLARDAVARWPLMKVLLTSGFPEIKLNGNGGPPAKMHLLSKPYRKDDLARALRKVLDAN